MSTAPFPVSDLSLEFGDLLFLSEFPPESRLGLGAQLASFRKRGCFIERWDELDPDVCVYLGDQVGAGGLGADTRSAAGRFEELWKGMAP